MSSIWPATPRRGAPASARSPWLRLAVAGALLAIAVQMLVMAQLAQHQVQRGAQLRQALAAEKAAKTTVARAQTDLPLHTASVDQGDATNPQPAYVLR